MNLGIIWIGIKFPPTIPSIKVINVLNNIFTLCELNIAPNRSDADVKKRMIIINNVNKNIIDLPVRRGLVEIIISKKGVAMDAI